MPDAKIIRPVRTCVIFNPAARGEKARRFRHQLDAIGPQCALKATTAPDDARRLAAEAVADGFELIVAAGGDGTVNEVLNGIGDAPDGFARARLGVLPLGTVNVFARELKIPLRIGQAWEALQRGRETRIDLPRVEFSANGVRQKKYFVQLAGAGHVNGQLFGRTDFSYTLFQHPKQIAWMHRDGGWDADSVSEQFDLMLGRTSRPWAWSCPRACPRTRPWK